MGVGTGHGDSQCPAIWKGSLLLLGKLRPGVSQKLIGVALLGSQSQLEWALGIKLVLGMYSPCLASGESVLLYFSFLRVSASLDNTGSHFSGWDLGS